MEISRNFMESLRLHFSEIKAPWYALPLVVGAWFFFYFVTSHVTVAPSPSVKPLILWRIDRTPSMGDYVTFPFSHPLIETNAKYWVKYLACTEGHTLKRESDVFYCDGQAFAEARLYSMKGDPLPQFHFDGEVPPKKAFVFGDGQNSFDSRHFGFVDTQSMQTNIDIF